MTRHFLFGPVTAEFAEQSIGALRASGTCLAFSSAGTADITISEGDTWDVVSSRLPAGWQPDFIALDLHYTQVPAGLWSTPVPIIGLAADWNLLWHHYRRCLTLCDLVITDTSGVEYFEQAGIDQVVAGNLFGCERRHLEAPVTDGKRDIDVLFVGNLSSAVQAERLPWLARLARLSDRYNIVIRSGVFGDAYMALLRRSKIVFNRSLRGECNLRAFEAAAAGALLFQEAENHEVANYFADRCECVYYTDGNLEELLDYYLTHPDDRQAIAAAAQAKVHAYSFASLWTGIMDHIEMRWDQVQSRARARQQKAVVPDFGMRLWQALSSPQGDSGLVEDIRRAMAENPHDAELHGMLGLALSSHGPDRNAREVVDQVRGNFEKALELAPRQLMGGLDLVEALAALGQHPRAAALCERLLTFLHDPTTIDPQTWQTPHYPPQFDLFRVEWERAAWLHAGNEAGEREAKRRLLRWRLETLLGSLTEDLGHYRAAVDLRPDLPVTQAVFGCAYGRAGRMTDAIPHLRHAVAGNPFDREAARALFEALRLTGDTDAQGALIQDRRRLARAVGDLLPAEAWHATALKDSAPVRMPTSPLKTEDLTLDQFHERFGHLDTSDAVSGFTPPHDTHVILTLLASVRPHRILEIGTAAGHMTANFTEWTPDDAQIISMGIVEDLAVPVAGQQASETPKRGDFGRHAAAFGKSGKIFFVMADALSYDFQRLAPLDFVFIDGAHDYDHVLSDSRNAYKALRPGGWLVWHDFGSSVPWVEVNQALTAAKLPEVLYHVAGTQVAFLQKQPVEAEAGGFASSDPQETTLGHAATESSVVASQEPLSILWEGAQADVHSLALVNRSICRRLIARGLDVCLHPHVHRPDDRTPSGTLDPELASRIRRPLRRPATIHVSHRWPPRLDLPSTGRWVLMQPWEFGSLPKAWLPVMRDRADEVWVYSSYLRDCYVQSGVPEHRIHVIPLGIEPRQYDPNVSPLPLESSGRFRFLFVGGTIYRKGIDVLLDAYTRAFRRSDDVSLVIKDMGVGSFYRGQTAGERIRELQSRPNAPIIEYIHRSLSEAELASLYAACNCFVLPYRGEGFGLPIIEAMACGLPVIVTGHGAAQDYFTDQYGYAIASRVVRFPERRVGSLETVDYPSLAEPDTDALISLLRHVAQHPDEARAKGEQASRHIREHWTWDRTVDKVVERLTALQAEAPSRATVLPSMEEQRSGAVPRNGRPSVSLCMIVKNEEGNLPACLNSIIDLVAEAVVVDTGSSDATKQIAATLGARVFDFPWVDSFAAARNESLRHARGDWIFWLDADDRLDAENRQRLIQLFASLDGSVQAYSMKCLCLPDPINRTATVVDHVRLFRNHPDIRWKYRVHEQILPSVRQLGGEVSWTDVVIHHVGYQDPQLRRRKLDRDLRLLQLDVAEQPEEPFLLFNLGSILQELGHVQEALPVLKRSLERSHPTDSIVRKLFAMLAQGYMQLGDPRTSLAICQDSRRYCINDPEMLFREGLARKQLGDAAGAEGCWLDVLQKPVEDHFGSVHAGLRGYLTRHNLAVLHREQGRLADAEAQWRQALIEEPSFLGGWAGLAELFISQKRWADVDQVLARLETTEPASAEGALLRAQAHLGRLDFAAARQLLETTIDRAPRELRARVLLTHALLQEGRDWKAAEQALRELLVLDPANGEAKQNLGVLLRMQGREV